MVAEREIPAESRGAGYLEGLGESAVVAALGRRRQGKTLLCAYLCAEAHRNGVRILHNGPLKFGEEINLQTLIELGPELSNAVIFLDEIHEYMDSIRGNSVVSYLLSHALVQAGHRSIWLLYTTQDERMISSRLRFQTDVVIDVRKRGQTIYFSAHHQGSIGPRGFARRGKLHRVSRFYHLYDTSKIISPFEALSMTSARVREQTKHGDLVKVRDLVTLLHQDGKREMAPGQIAIYLAGTYGVQLSPERVGKYLVSLGIAGRRTKYGMVYRLKDFSEASDA